MTCAEFEVLEASYLDGVLSDVERKRWERHSRECPACRSRLAEVRRVIDVTGRLRAPVDAAADPGWTAALESFRRHGLHADRVRARDIPLGIGKHVAAPGDHIAYLMDSPQDLPTMAGYLAAGFERGESCVLVGQDAANQRVLAGLERLGLRASELERQDLLHVATPSRSGDQILGALDARIKASVDRGLTGVRILGNLAWGEPGWPEGDEHLRLEARVTDAVRRYPSIVLCAYETGQLSERTLRKGGFECHPAVLYRDALRVNDAYVPAAEFLARL
jgi:anti-sigma factor RsiW